jgi:hypothetical protein
MAKTSALITLHQVVKSLQLYGDLSGEDYFKLLGLVGRGLNRLNMLHDPSVISVYEENLSNLTNGVLGYPQDCIKVIDVYFKEEGQLKPLVRRKDIAYKDGYAFPLPYTRGVDSVDEINDQYDGKFALTGGKSEYYYKDDVSNRRLIFDVTADEDIWVWYVGTGIDSSLGEDTMVPVLYQPFLERYVLYENSILKNRKQDAEFYEQKMNTSIKEIKYFRLPSLNEIKDAIYSTYSQGPKR